MVVLAILCGSTYCNNNNYFPLLIVLYMYSAKAKVDVITFFNHCLLIFYNVLQKKLQDISFSSKQ